MSDKHIQEQIKTIYRQNQWMMDITEHDWVYISGPMSGLPNFNRENFWLMEHALKLRRCRISTPARYEGDHPYAWLMRQGLAMVLSANTVVMLDGWQNSKGANMEHNVATMVDNQIFYVGNELLNRKYYESKVKL